MEEIKAYTTSFSFLLGAEKLGEVSKRATIEVYHNVFEDADPTIYEPIIGKVKGTNYLCYGIRIAHDTMIFKIFCHETNQAYLCTVVDDIVSLACIYNSMVIRQENAKEYFFQIDNWQKNELKVVDAHNLVFDVQSRQQNQTDSDVDNLFAADYNDGELAYNDYLGCICVITRSTFSEMICNYLDKYGVEDVSTITDNKKLIKCYNKDISKFYDLLDKLSTEELYNMYLKVKKDLPNQQVFEEFSETLPSLLTFDMDNLQY